MSVSAQAVPGLSILYMCVSLLICFGVPIGLAIWAKVKYKKEFSFMPLLLGAAGFFVFQIIIRVSVLIPLFNSTPWVKGIQQGSTDAWIYGAILCLTAGLFEEPVRFAVFSVLKKNHRFQDGLSYGIGHGGIEAILLVGLSYINNIIYSLMINSGTFEKLIGTLPAAASGQLQQLQQGLLSLPSTTFLLGGVERFLTIIIQIGFTMVVLKGFQTNRKWLYLILATLLHAVVDYAVVSLQILKAGPWAIEGVIFVFAAIALAYIIKQAMDWRRQAAAPQEAFYAEQGQADHP